MLSNKIGRCGVCLYKCNELCLWEIITVLIGIIISTKTAILLQSCILFQSWCIFTQKIGKKSVPITKLTHWAGDWRGALVWFALSVLSIAFYPKLFSTFFTFTFCPPFTRFRNGCYGS